MGTRLRLLAVNPLSTALSILLWNNLNDPVFDGVGLAGFKSRPIPFLLA